MVQAFSEISEMTKIVNNKRGWLYIMWLWFNSVKRTLTSPLTPLHHSLLAGYDQSVVCKGGWSPVLQDASTTCILLFLIALLEEDCQSHLLLYWVLIYITSKVSSSDRIIQTHFLLNTPLQNKWMTWQNQKNQM